MNSQENEASEQGFVLIANEILRKCKIEGKVQSLNECSDSFFVAVYEGILGEALVGIFANAISYEQRVSNCEKVIDGLSHDVLNVDLSHITAENIVDGDIATIQNLLEIFKELLDFILDVDDEFDLESAATADDEQNDSNLLLSDHEVIFNVLQEELGPKPSGRLSSDGSTIGEPELSSIPKCSDVSSSRNSDGDSTSTDEIIRESELLERQLSRDYPSLRRLKDQKESERTLGLPKEKVSKDIRGTSFSNLPTSSGLADLNGAGPLSIGKNVGKITRKMIGKHEDIAPGPPHRQNMPGFNGISEAIDSVPSTSIGSLRDTRRAIRDIEVLKTGRSGGTLETIDNVPRVSRGITRNVHVHTGTTRDTYVPRSRTFGDDSIGVDKVHRLGSSIRKPVVIPTDLAGEVCTPRDSEGFALGGRERQDRTTVDNSGYHRRVDGERDGQKSTLVNEREKLSQDNDYRSKPSSSKMSNKPRLGDREDSTQETVPNRKGSSMHVTKNSSSVVKTFDFPPQKWTTSLGGDQNEKHSLKSKKDLRVGGTKTKGDGDGGSSLGKAATRIQETSTLLEKHSDDSEDNAKMRDKDAEKSGHVESRLGVRGERSGGRRSSEDSKGSTDGKKGKENKRPRGIVGDQRKSRLKNDIEGRKVRKKQGTKVHSRKARDSVLKRMEDTETIKGHTDGSESSGVFWDDQISPLDVSERLRNPSQGLAFDEIGLPKKSRDYEARQGLGKSKDSPVIRHYHHHFHHGSSEDLTRDVDFSEKSRQISKADPGSSFSRQDRRNLAKESSHVSGKEETMKKGEPRKRYVKFDDHVDTLLITNRLERLRREMELEDGKQNEKRSHIKNGYSGYLERLNKEHKRMEKELKQKPKKTKSPYRKKHGVVSRDRAPTNQRKARYPSTKARKRSSSSSPKIRKNKQKAAKQLEKGDIILPTLLDEFPFLHLSPHTLQTMRRKQTQQLTSLSKSAQADKRQTKTQKVIEDAEKRQQTLLKILRKDLQHNQRMREQKERSEQERVIKSKLREKRHATARARRYYEDYQLRMRARMLKRRTREEQIFKNLFEDGLEIQKQRVHELRSYAKEQREKRAVRQQDELESLENYYRDQYSIMAEAITQEKEALLVREKAQERVIHDMQRNLREKLRNEVTEIQETLVRDEDDAYFRRLDAERLRRQLQMTAFQNLS